MPYYDFRCNVCGDTLPHFRKVEQRDLPAYHCAAEMQRVLSAPHIRGDLTPFQSPVTGQWINSRSQRDEELKREGCILNEPGMKRDIARRREALAEQNLAKIDASIDREVSALQTSNVIPGD